MKALSISQRPGVGQLAEVIRIEEVDPPRPRGREVLVEVVASCINVDDIHFAQGTMYGGLPISPRPSLSKPVIPGTDVAGIVRAVGEKVTRTKPGDEVFGVHNPMNRHGAWAENCLVREDRLLPKPPHLTFTESAACGLGGLVAVDAVQRSGVKPGQTCVLVGASGGIGSLILQILHHKGVSVVGVCSSRNVGLVESLGAERVIDYTKESFAQVLPKAGVVPDVAIDCVGGKDVEAEAFKVLPKKGIFLTLVGPVRFIGGSRLGPWGISKVFGHITGRMLTGALWGPRYSLAAPGKKTYPNLKAVLADGGIKPLIDREVPFAEETMREALDYVSSHRAQGKVVIRI